MQTINERIQIVERDRKLYESYEADSVNSHKCIRAYHEWYSQAAVLFDELIPSDDAEYLKFRAVDNEGNGYTLNHNYHAIFSSYFILINRLKTGRYGAVTNKEMIKTTKTDKIYQVFVSSTYEDLKLERQEVMAAVVSTGNVPIGMEYFPAGDAAPFDYIKKQIDGADYYILIVAGKYGSINEETGISYTEMEFDYAISKGVPVAVLLHQNITKLPGSKLEMDDPNKKQLLDSFRTKVKTGRMVSFWEDEKDLRLLVKDALNNMIKESPRTGWIRADKAISISKDTNDDLLKRTIPMHYSEFGVFGMSSVDLALLPQSITIAELLKIVVPVLRIPKVESSIDEALKGKYNYLKDESIEGAKQVLLRNKLVETNNLVIQNEGVYTVWFVTPMALELWASMGEDIGF